MIVQIIVAADERNGIGKDNQLPWHLPNDLKFFKQKTLGHPIIMGRKTFESIGKPLPGRLNVVLSKSAQSLPEGALLQHDLQEALSYCRKHSYALVSIIGGGEIFKHGLHFAQKIWLTRVHTVIEGATVFFPEIDTELWKRTMQEPHPQDDKHAYAYTFEEWHRMPVM